MTISSERRISGPFSGNGQTTQFPFDFKVFDPDQISVVVDDTALSRGFSVTLNASQEDAPGGTVTLATPLASGQNLAILSNVPNLQPLALTNQGGFYPTVLNEAFDRSTIQIQQLLEALRRAVKVSPTSSETPEQLLQRIFEAQQTAIAKAQAASASAAQAKQSKDQASASQTAAATSETNAAQSEAEAKTALGQFEQWWLGDHPTPPGTMRDGTSLRAGAMYYDSTLNGVFYYAPTTGWLNFGFLYKESTAAGTGVSGPITYFYYVVAAGQNTVTGVDQFGHILNYIPNKILVMLNGIPQPVNSYIATNGTSITINGAPLHANDEVSVLNFGPFGIEAISGDDFANNSLKPTKLQPIPQGKIIGLQAALAQKVNQADLIPPARLAAHLPVQKANGTRVDIALSVTERTP